MSDGVRRGRGFTLISVMITVAIIGILATVAYPSYVQQVRKARRADAKIALMRAAGLEEQRYTTTHAYTADLASLGLVPASDGAPCALTENRAYEVCVTLGPDADTFELEARATPRQRGDRCATFRLSSDGAKHAFGAAGEDLSATCW